MPITMVRDFHAAMLVGALMYTVGMSALMWHGATYFAYPPRNAK